MSLHQIKDTNKTIALLHRKEEEDRARLVAKKHQLPYLNLSTIALERDALKTISRTHAQEGKIAIFKRVGKHLKIALTDPNDPATKSILKRLEEERYVCDFFVVSHSSMKIAHRLYEKIVSLAPAPTGSIAISSEQLLLFKEQLRDRANLEQTLTQASATNTTTILEIILAGALRVEASDIHIETVSGGAHMRFRIDGVLHDISPLSLKIYRLILSRIKLLSELKLNLHDVSQDGRFTIHLPDEDIEIRTSILPGPEGENIVLRLLDPKLLKVSFEHLGMQPWIREALDREIKQPYGMIITTGPTGSGKTTALYAILRRLKSPELKIITLEDPIEYHIPGLEQTQIDAEHGYDFPKGLRAIVRQDPDVILIGEIRDLDTAETALNAANTGHLVFSTLHTNNTAGAIPRFITLGAAPANIASALNLIMAQRLMRMLCLECRVPIEDQTLFNFLAHALSNLPSSIPVPKKKDWTIFQARTNGCDVCYGMGYKGRIGIFEIILVDDTLEALILKEPSELAVRNAAREQQQITMQEDGLLKIIAGITDRQELERVVGTLKI